MTGLYDSQVAIDLQKAKIGDQKLWIPDPEHRYVVGVDWGRECNKYSAIVVIDFDTNTVVSAYRLGEIGWQAQRGYVQFVYEYWKPAIIGVESNSIGSINIEALQAEGLPIRTLFMTTRAKLRLVMSLLHAIETRVLILRDDKILLKQLIEYRVFRDNQSGREQYYFDPPPGGHDDMIIALALAWCGRVTGCSVDFV